MKKLLSLLGVLTISGTAVPATIAASAYQKEENLNNDFFSLEQSKNTLKIYDNDNFVEKLRQDLLKIFSLRSYVEQNSLFSSYITTMKENNKYLILNNKQFQIYWLGNFNYIKTGNQIFLIYDDKIKEIKFNDLNTGTSENILINLHSAPNYHIIFTIKEERFNEFKDNNNDDRKNWGWIIETSNGKYSLTFYDWLNDLLARKYKK